MRKTLFLPSSPRNVDFRMRKPAQSPPKALKVRDVFRRILAAKIRLSWFARFDTRTAHFDRFLHALDLAEQAFCFGAPLDPGPTSAARQHRLVESQGCKGEPFGTRRVNVGSVPISIMKFPTTKEVGTLREQKGNRKGTERSSVDNTPAHRGQAPDGRPAVRVLTTSPNDPR